MTKENRKYNKNLHRIKKLVDIETQIIRENYTLAYVLRNNEVKTRGYEFHGLRNASLVARLPSSSLGTKGSSS